MTILDPVPVVHAGVYHRRSRETCLVTAIHRPAGAVVGYDLWNDYTKVKLTGVPCTEVDLWHNEVPGTAFIWRDLQPGMAMLWIDGIQALSGEPEPQQLDVLAIRRPGTDDGPWEIDAVQGRYSVDPTLLFEQVTPELADRISSVVIEEQHRWMR